MWAVYALLALVLLVLIVLSIPITGRICYDGDLTVYVRVLGVRIPLYPTPEKERASQPRSKKRKAADSPSKWQELRELLKQDDLEGTLHFIGEVARLAGRTAGKLLRAITITQMHLQLLIATGDPADTAQLYGVVCGGLYPMLEQIGQRMRRVRQRHVRVEPNFLLEQSCARFDVRFRASVWRLLGAAFTLAGGFILLRDKDKPQMNKEVS